MVCLSMATINIHQAKTNFSHLLSRVSLGEEIVIANRGVPVAKLVPFRSTTNRRDSLGLDQGRYQLPDDFNNPLPEAILSAFEGENE